MSEIIDLTADLAADLAPTRKRDREDPTRMVCVMVVFDDGPQPDLAFFPEAELTAQHKEWLEILRNSNELTDEIMAWVDGWPKHRDVPEGCVATSIIMVYPDCC